MAVTTSELDHRHPALVSLIDAGFGPGRIDQTLRFYDEPHRAYHDREHLREMFDATVDLREPLSATQALALLFHDIVYVPGAARGSNEAMSAQLLRVYTGMLDLVLVEAAAGIVIDTADHKARSREAEFVLDLDLMRLAASAPDFDRYSRQVFAEQRPLIAIADDATAWSFFAARRVAFFQQLLERPAIFHTAACRAHFEARARANLARAIDAVRAAGSRGTV